MKKLLSIISLLFLLIIGTSCKKQDVTIQKENMKVEFSVYDLLPQMFHGEDILPTAQLDPITPDKTLSYFKLSMSYQYIDQLFKAYDLFLSGTVNHSTLKLNQTYHYLDYTYYVKKVGSIYHVYLTEDLTGRKLVLDMNGNQTFNGTHEFNGNKFAFNLTKDQSLYMKFDKNDTHTTIETTINKTGGDVLTSIYYTNSDYAYRLFSVGNDEMVTVYYDYDQKDTETKDFEAYNNKAELIYVSYDHGINQATGFCVNTLSGYQTIKQTSNKNYLIDEKEFVYNPDLSNLYDVNVKTIENQMKIQDTSVLILGNLTFSDKLDNIVSIRTPFSSSYGNELQRLTTKLESLKSK